MLSPLVLLSPLTKWCNREKLTKEEKIQGLYHKYKDQLKKSNATGREEITLTLFAIYIYFYVKNV